GRQPAGALGGTGSQPVLPRPLQASFRFEKLARQVVVTLIRPETQEVVCQIPPEKILNLIVYLRQVVGAAFDKRA
ncbi:MAG: flagellar protein FlaG, partial [Planctomycetes bacterium]|nr:flagellar protein FlaG [Planctomycetota bacterium]